MMDVTKSKWYNVAEKIKFRIDVVKDKFKYSGCKTGFLSGK